MSSNRWANRLFPPLVLVAVVGGVWYAVTHRTEDLSVSGITEDVPVAASSKAAPKPSVETETISTPTVEKLPGVVKFTVDTKKFVNVQKVEFYVSNRLVGAAYSEPYTISVNEVILQPGTHRVVAKVFTETDTKSTPSADFVSTAVAGVKASDDAIAPSGSSATETPAAPPAAPTAPAPAPTVSAPTNVTAFAVNGPAVELDWEAPIDGSADSYKIIRNGVAITTTFGTTYIDTTVSEGQTYDYEIVSVGNGSASSAPSAAAAVTIPVPAPDPDPVGASDTENTGV